MAFLLYAFHAGLLAPGADIPFLGHLLWVSKFKTSRKRKTNALHKNKKLPSVTPFRKLNI